MELLLPALLGRATVRAQSPFAAHEFSEPEPDVAIVPWRDYATTHPDKAYAIIGIADSSLASDREAKQHAYARCGVPEYWIANLHDRCIEVYTDPDGSTYTSVALVDHAQWLRLQRFPELEVRVADVIR